MRKMKLGLIALTMALFGSVTASAVTVNGLFYGDGDEHDYYLYNTSEYDSGLYIYQDGDILNVALVVDRSVNDNVFNMKNTDKDYLNSVGWNGTRHAKQLTNSEYAAFEVSCGGNTWSWQQAYGFRKDGATGPTDTWYSDDTQAPGLAGAPTSYVSSSSFAANINNWNAHYLADGTELWDLYYNSSTALDRWKSPYDPANGQTPNGLEGYPAPTGTDPWDGPKLTYSATYQFEWPMVYEWSINLNTVCGSNPVSALSGASHHSPLKSDGNDENDDFPDLVDPLTDYGDLPDTYGTVKASSGARHNIIINAPYLGERKPDAETDGNPSTGADADDNSAAANDEDGITFTDAIIPGQTAHIDVNVSSECDSITCYFYGWIDFNADGDFADAGEQIFFDSDPALTAGTHTLEYDVPATASMDTDTYARFRITTDSGIGSTGLATDGEVEDYAITTLPVTLAYVYPRRSENGLDVDFTTDSELLNAGFNIYAIKKGKWTKLNKKLIEGELDSTGATNYSVHVANPFGKKLKKIGISGVDINGREDRHGPFEIGKENGVKAEAKTINWKKIRQEEKSVRKAKKAERKAGKTEQKTTKKVTRKLFENEIVNLQVSEGGVYRVTHSNLLNAGIDFSGQKVKRIAISLKGESVARHISGVTKHGKWTKNSAIEFKGKAASTKDALYLSVNSYQLSLKKKLVVKSEGIKPTTIKELVFEENKRYSPSNPSDDPFYDGRTYLRGAGTQGVMTRNLDMPKLPEGTSTVTVSLSTLSKGIHHAILTLNGEQIADVYSEGYTVWPVTVEVDNRKFVEGSNELKITVKCEKSGSEMVLYDKTTVRYEGIKQNAVKTPTIVLSDIVNKKELKIKRGTDYLIISHPMFMGETLDRYMKQRRSEGWKIKVVDVEDIYDAYGYATATPEAIKAYLQMAQEKGVTHVQLVGAASYDPHNYLGYGSISFIPSNYVYTGQYNYHTSSDTPYVVDKNGLPTMAIGRWPVRTLAQLEAVVNKTLAWKSTGQSAKHTALLIADRGNNFVRQINQMAGLFSDIANWTEIEKVNLSELIEKHDGDKDAAVTEARSAIKLGMESGASVTIFSGHSSTWRWSFSGLLTDADLPSIENVDSATLALPLACYTTYADSPKINNLAHQMIAAGENGAVAIYGATMLSKLAENKIMATKVIEALLDGETLGKAIKNTKRSLGLNYRNVIYNNNLLGDVTLKLK